jgi:hypothetical protein
MGTGQYSFDSQLTRFMAAARLVIGPSDRSGARQSESRNDVGRDLVFDKRDPVSQQELAFFQPLQAQQIRGGRLMQRINRRIQIAVFLLQACEFGLQFALVLVGHDL